MRTLLLIFTGLIHSSAYADRSYDIELLIYKQTNLDEHFHNEKWSNSWFIPNTEDSLNLRHIPSDKKNLFRPLDSSETSFANIIKSIKKSKRYDFLSYQAWRQPGLGKDDIVNIHIYDGKIYAKETELPLIKDGNEANIGTLFVQQNQLDESIEPYTNQNVNLPLTLRYRPIVNAESIAFNKRIYELDGTVKIVLSRFLHFYSDLLLLEPVSIKAANSHSENSALISDDNEDVLLETEKPKFNVNLVEDDGAFTTLHGFNIKEHRRMRSGELHYIDHPFLGMIIKVTPVKEENN